MPLNSTILIPLEVVISQKMWFYHSSLPIFTTVLEILLLLYPIIILLMARPTFQRHALYGHKGYGFVLPPPNPTSDLEVPESGGFLRNQVTSHSIPTPDGQNLYAWLVMPIGAYAKNESTLTKNWSAEEARKIVLQILTSDPQAVLVVYLHGSGNNLATQWRCEAYRNLSAGSPEHLYVLAFDYRGFGKSSGIPTEDGLILDAFTVLSWIEKELGIPRPRTLLLGHSLGVAVTIAAVQEVVKTNPGAEYAGLLLCSGATDMPKLAANFKLAGIIPIVKPLTWFKQGKTWIEEKLLVDTWRTQPRLRDLIQRCRVIRISLLHAENDDRTPCEMSDALYDDCLDELAKLGNVVSDETDLGEGGTIQEMKVGGRSVRKVTLKRGRHNMYLNWHIVNFEATRLFMMTGAID